jgi:hypothetical protein
VPVQAVLIPVADDEGGLARIAVQGDMVGHEAVAQGVLRWAFRFDVEEWFTVPFPLLILPGNVVRLDEQAGPFEGLRSPVEHLAVSH